MRVSGRYMFIYRRGYTRLAIRGTPITTRLQCSQHPISFSANALSELVKLDRCVKNRQFSKPRILKCSIVARLF